MTDQPKIYDVELPVRPIERARFNMDDFANWLAHQSDFEQARFFDGFADALEKSCDGCSTRQVAAISSSLNKNTRELLRDLGYEEDE